MGVSGHALASAADPSFILWVAADDVVLVDTSPQWRQLASVFEAVAPDSPSSLRLFM